MKIPDWLTHLSIAYLLGRLISLNPRKRAIFLLGALMPDFERFMSLLGIIIGSIRVELFFIKMLTAPFHSLLGVLLLTFFLGAFLPTEQDFRPYLLLFTGGLVHLLLDMIMWPWGGGYPLLFPLRSDKYMHSLGLIWPGDLTLPLLIGLPISLILIYDRKKGEKTTTDNTE